MFSRILESLARFNGFDRATLASEKQNYGPAHPSFTPVSVMAERIWPISSFAVQPIGIAAGRLRVVPDILAARLSNKESDQAH